MVFVLYTLELGMLFRRSYFFIIIDKTMNQNPSPVSATAVINRVFNFWTGHKYCKGFGKWASSETPRMGNGPHTPTKFFWE